MFVSRHVARITEGMDDPGTIQWELVIALFVAWFIVGAVLIKGVASLGKIVYVTAIFPC